MITTTTTQPRRRKDVPTTTITTTAKRSVAMQRKRRHTTTTMTTMTHSCRCCNTHNDSQPVVVVRCLYIIIIAVLFCLVLQCFGVIILWNQQQQYFDDDVDHHNFRILSSSSLSYVWSVTSSSSLQVSQRRKGRINDDVVAVDKNTAAAAVTTLLSSVLEHNTFLRYLRVGGQGAAEEDDGDDTGTICMQQQEQWILEWESKHLANNEGKDRIDLPNSNNSNDEEWAFSSRPLRSIQQQQQQQQEEQLLLQEEEPKLLFSYLIIGGVDGSGTRSYVQILQDIFNVHMIYDDHRSFDVHGTILSIDDDDEKNTQYDDDEDKNGTTTTTRSASSTSSKNTGWPPIVNMILRHTHSVNYKISDVPEHVQTLVLRKLFKLKRALTIQYRYEYGQRYVQQQQQQQQQRLEQNEKESRTGDEEPSNQQHQQERNDTMRYNSTIVFGFKAPVTMLLLPFLKEAFGNIKFIHVVRDGRDIATSNNQSPVQKFYDTFYVDAKERRSIFDPNYEDWTSNSNNKTIVHRTTLKTVDNNSNNKQRKLFSTQYRDVLAIQLWNDWNVQLLQWEQKQQQQQQQQNGHDEQSNNGTTTTIAPASQSTFEYLVMRTEDLLNPETRYRNLLRLADFIGSNIPTSTLCWRSSIILADLGHSAVEEKQYGREGGGDAYHRDRIDDHNYSPPWRRVHKFDQTTDTDSMRRRTRASRRRELGRRQQQLNQLRQHQQEGSGSNVLGGDTPDRRRRRLQMTIAGDSNNVVGHNTVDDALLKRYGRWKSIFADQPERLYRLMRHGAEGLRIFGYRPERHDLHTSSS